MKNKLTAQALKSFALFKDFSDEDLANIIGLFNLSELQKDEILFLDGEGSNYLYFVVKGWLKAEKISLDGRQQTLRYIGPEELINELSIFLHESDSVTVIAMENAQVFNIHRRDVETLLNTYPQFSRGVIRNLAKRIQYLLNRVENLALYPVEVRLARFILNEAEEGIFTRQSWETQAEIASHLGTVLDVVNRNLQKFVKQGIIEINRNQIKIIDRQGLETIARG